MSKWLAFLLSIGVIYVPVLDANVIFASRGSVDEPVAETRDQEVARLLAPRGRTPEQADASAAFAVGGLGYLDAAGPELVGTSASLPPSSGGLYSTAASRDARRASHKIVPAFESGDVWSPPAKSAPYIDKVREVEETYGMPGNLMAALVTAESAWNPKAKSSAGAKGLTQLMPVHKVDTTDTDAAIEYGAEYLALLKDEFGTWELALAAYNWGPGNLSKKGIEKAPKSTHDYVKKIMSKIHVDDDSIDEEPPNKQLASNQHLSSKGSVFTSAKKYGLDSYPKLDSVSDYENISVSGKLSNKKAVSIAQKVPLHPQ